MPFLIPQNYLWNFFMNGGVFLLIAILLFFTLIVITLSLFFLIIKMRKSKKRYKTKLKFWFNLPFLSSGIEIENSEID